MPPFAIISLCGGDPVVQYTSSALGVRLKDAGGSPSGSIEKKEYTMRDLINKNKILTCQLFSGRFPEGNNINRPADGACAGKPARRTADVKRDDGVPRGVNKKTINE
jgi:hypothetical protein